MRPRPSCTRRFLPVTPSPRYSAIAALGLLRWAASLGDDPRAVAMRSRVGEVVEALHRRGAGKVCPATTRAGEFSVGDLGLVLWLDTATGRADSGTTFERLRRATASFSANRLARVTAMELAWILLGCTAARHDLASAEPMARAALEEAGGPRLAEAVEAGIGWVFGANELGQVMADVDSGRFHRAIERPRVAARLGAARIVVAPRRGRAATWEDTPPRLTVNRAARSYELGWLLYAWAGREAKPCQGELLAYASAYMWVSD